LSKASELSEEERRTLYLTRDLLRRDLEEVRDVASNALSMRDIESYGETTEEVTGWAWTISDHQSRVWVAQERWETHVFGPFSKQALPPWITQLLVQIREELEKADNATQEAKTRLNQYIAELEIEDTEKKKMENVISLGQRRAEKQQRNTTKRAG
jgi:hypothetical protein